MLDLFGNEPALKVILFTLDETTYARGAARRALSVPQARPGVVVPR
jgi:glucuronate isomerase